MGKFFKRIFQFTTAIIVILLCVFLISIYSSKLSVRDVALVCVLDEATQRAALLVAKTELTARNLDDGPSWTRPKLRIVPESYVEIRNDFISGQKLFRRVDMQGTSLNGLSEIRRITETNTQYKTGFYNSDWSTSIIIDRDTLLMTETINLPSDFKGELWTRKCSIISGKDFDEAQKRVMKNIKAKQKI